MAATITMPTEPIEVAPGASTAFTVTVRNIGSVVDMIVVEVLGDAAPWATVTPSAVSLFPATDSTVAVSITVPRDSRIAAGSVPVAVRASARDQPGPATEETTLEILPFADAAIFLAPTVSKGSRKGSHELSVDNLGNVALQATLSALCDDADVRIEPATLLVEPGQQGNAAVTVVPEKRFSRGPSVTHAFTLVVEPEGGLALSTPGSMLQEATVPRWVFKAALLLLVLAIALPLLWFALLKPTVRSTAKDAAIEEITAATAPVTIGATGGQNADPSKGGAKGGAGAGTGGATVGGAGAATTVAGGGTSTGGTAGTGAGAGVGGAGGVGGVGTLQPIDGRLFLTAAGSTSFTVPAARVLQVTDIVLQNPASNTGSIQIKRGDDVLLDVALENFRDLDYHFVTPLTFTPGQKLTLAAACTSSGCTPSSLFSGTLATSS